MPKVFAHSLILFFSVLMTFLWVTTPSLSQYDLQASAVLFLVFMGMRNLGGQEFFKLIESIVSTIIILLIVSSTGGVLSPLFFLVYFLLFSVSIVLEPAVPFVLSLLLIPFFILTSKWDGNWMTLTQLSSLPFITPFAILLGKEYLKVQEDKRTITRLNFDNQKLNREKTQEEKNVMLWLTTILHNHVRTIVETAENYKGDHDLETIKKAARRLETLGGKLKEEMEK